MTESNSTVEQADRSVSRDWLRRLGRLAAPFIGLFLVLGIFTVIEPGSFPSVRNGQTIAVQTVVVGIGALGMCFVIVCGGIDLSIGSVIALASVAGAMTLDAGYGPTAAMAMAGGTGAVCGLINGGLVTALRIPPFIVTLGMLGIARGLAKLLAGNQRIAPPPESLGWLEGFVDKTPEIAWLLVAPAAWCLLAIAILAGFVLRRTAFGVQVVAIGSSEPTARLCGVPVARTKILVYVLCGLSAGVAGAVTLGRLGVGDPTTAVGLELQIIAAVVIGGASLSGGEGGILGTMIGAFMLSCLSAGCTLAGIDNSIQEIIIGGIIVAAVTIDGLRQRRNR
ncbi:MAG: ABC transporter permease [Planctomycetota bacterium]|nr:ABC transporter permease [Planctomycetota bacterium]MDA1026580.1 ABC transporter permease [Planctomycetota bacterium]